MGAKTLEDELDRATREFLRTYNSFREAAVKLMEVMNGIEKKGLRRQIGPPRMERQVHRFLIQLMCERGRIVENCFELNCVAEEGNGGKE